MNIIKLIEKKKTKKELTSQEIQFVINHYLRDKITDYQMSALLMAIWFNGMSDQEVQDLTITMAESGTILDLSAISGKKVDKHSTGGVGDKTSLALLPMVAAAGLCAPKISGCGLGHTGGTIDKFASISGLQTELPIDRFVEIVKEINFSIIAASVNLVPADKKLYALRDVTGTIDSIPLIASSIMSKKIAGGADAFVLDVTFGRGSFLKTISDAVSLGETMVNIGHKTHKETIAVITSMNQPLGYAVGNSLEMQEAIALLKNEGPDDLRELCLFLGSLMLMAGGIVQEQQEGMRVLQEVLTNGHALSKLKEMVKRQNGNADQVENPDLLPVSKYQKNIYSGQKGYIGKLDARKIGEASMLLGAGRTTKEDQIDLSAGIVLRKKRGSLVNKEEILATVHYNDEQKMKAIEKQVENAFLIVEKKPEDEPLIAAIIDSQGLRMLN